MKNFWENIIRSSASDTVLKKLTRTTLTKSNTVRASDPRNLERFLSLDDRLLIDHLLTPSFFVDTFEETFGHLGYYIQCLGNFFVCFLLINSSLMLLLLSSDDSKFKKNSGANFGFVRTVLGATFQLFVLSL